MIYTATVQQADYARNVAAAAPKQVEVSLLDGLHGALAIAHSRVNQLDALASRIFGELPPGPEQSETPRSPADELLFVSRTLVERLNAVCDRLERIKS